MARLVAITTEETIGTVRGMRQRVSIARAFATSPKLLLLDEPFGALDVLPRGVIQGGLIKIWSGTQQAVFMITHDVDEAILLADRILLRTNGPRARVAAEPVKINIGRSRNRADIINDPAYCKIRNYLLNFLVKRSGELSASEDGSGGILKQVDSVADTEAELNEPVSKASTSMAVKAAF